MSEDRHYYHHYVGIEQQRREEAALKAGAVALGVGVALTAAVATLPLLGLLALVLGAVVGAVALASFPLAPLFLLGAVGAYWATPSLRAAAGGKLLALLAGVALALTPLQLASTWVYGHHREQLAGVPPRAEWEVVWWGVTHQPWLAVFAACGLAALALTKTATRATLSAVGLVGVVGLLLFACGLHSDQLLASATLGILLTLVTVSLRARAASRASSTSGSFQ